MTSLDLSVDGFDRDVLAEVDAVAISVPMHTAMRLATDLVTTIRLHSPQLPIALYGLYAGMGDLELVERVIIGEYEQQLVGWVDSLAEGRPDSGAVTSLSRLRFAVPDRSTLPGLDRYAHLVVGDTHRQVGYTEASHGCRHRCRHCPLPAVYDGRFRIVQTDTVLEDVARLVDAGAEHVTFGDPDFFNGVHHGMRVLRDVNVRYPDLTFDLTIKVEHLLEHRDHLPELVKRNVLFVTSAFESTNDDVLALLDKGHTRADMVQLLTFARSAGLDIHPSWLPFTPWTAAPDLADIFSFIDQFDLFEVTEPIQLAIRLLIPRGSLVLDIPGISDMLGPYDDASLTYPWSSPDPVVDSLQRQISGRAEQAVEQGESLEATLISMWTMALDAAGVVDASPQIPAGAIVGRPRLTEPWFC